MKFRIQNEKAEVVFGLQGIPRDHAQLLMLIPDGGREYTSLAPGEGLWAKDRCGVRYFVIREDEP